MSRFAKMMKSRLRSHANRGDWRYIIFIASFYAMMIADLYGNLAVRKR